MRLLLDTHTFLWWVEGSKRLGAKAKRAIEDSDNACFVSVATAWELAIKSGLGKLRLSRPSAAYFTHHVTANGLDVLPIELEHVARVEALPLHHRDPFDRLLVAQALAESLDVASADATFAAYGARRIW